MNARLGATSPLKLGAICWNQYTDWQGLLAAGQLADLLGYDSLWTWDHVYPIVGSPQGPIFEGWLTITAWAATTQRSAIGLMVGANTFREPSLVAKMATTLDHISGGRAVLGIGSAWFREEHAAFGFPFGEGAPERLRWLGEALPVIRGMLRGEHPSAAGARYHATEVRNDPRPLQRHLPILVGGGGEQVTLKLVARYADANNVGGTLENVKRKEAVLLRHCESVGPRSGGDRADHGAGCRRHPRLARGGPPSLRGPVPRQRRGTAVAGPARRDPRGCRRAPCSVPGARVSTPDHRVSRAIRRGIDDPAGPRGQADAGACELIRDGSGAVDGLTAVSWGSDRIDLFWLDAERAVWHRAWSGGRWQPAESLGGTVAFGPAVTAWAVDQMEVFAVFDDGQLWDRYWDGTNWHAWESLEGELAGQPAASSWGPDRLDVFAPGRDGRTWHRWWDGTRWVPWEQLPA